MKNEYLVWIDMEMTGLDPRYCVILEIATLLTDDRLQIISEGPHLVIHHPAEVLADMEDWSRMQHGASGLLDSVRHSTISCHQAEEETLAFLKKDCKEGVCPLCGNSVWQDRRFMIKYMPRLESFLHYRNIDVSSVKELTRRWYPELPPYKKKKAHLAMDDIKDSISELRYYRDKVFIPSRVIP
jgi:oligoribonuclease